jgi:hypothetical protein
VPDLPFEERTTVNKPRSDQTGQDEQHTLIITHAPDRVSHTSGDGHYQ